MVKVVHQPPKELIILECSKYPSPKALAHAYVSVLSAGHAVILNWTNGVIFTFNPLAPTTDEVMREYLNGRVYWESVSFALMPECTPRVKVGTVEIPVVDVSYNKLASEVAKWLSQHYAEL